VCGVCASVDPLANGRTNGQLRLLIEVDGKY
jgi:hypothetical protein